MQHTTHSSIRHACQLVCAAALLGSKPPGQPLINRLARAKDVPPFLEPVFANAFFRIYKVRDE